MAASLEVEDWLENLDHPLKATIRLVREVILNADVRVEECIKWKSPTFTFRGNIASINPQARKHVSLMFHRGADIPGTYPSLEGGGEVARYMRFLDEQDVERKAGELQTAIRAWCEMKES